MAPSSKSEKGDGKSKALRKHKDHLVKLLVRGKLSGHFSQRLFRQLPPRVCVPLKNIVSEEFLRAGHIFLGFTKCGRYVLSYTSDCGEDDDFSFYTYRLYWWEFNLHSRLKQVHHVRLFAGEEIYSDLYLTVCEWPNDTSKIVIFGFNTRSSSSVLNDVMMSDDTRDIYITIASMPPPKPCSKCCPVPSASTIRTGGDDCLEHGYVLNSRYQVVYPFPTFQPAFQLKKDQVILLNTSYSLVACGISLCSGKQDPPLQILYTKRLSSPNSCPAPANLSSLHQGSPESRPPPSKPCPLSFSCSHSQSQAAARAREFAADLFRRAQVGSVVGVKENEEETTESPAEKGQSTRDKGFSEIQKQEPERLTSLPQASTSAQNLPCSLDQGTLPSPSSPSSPPTPSSAKVTSAEPGYVNYSHLHYRLPQPGAPEQGTEPTSGAPKYISYEPSSSENFGKWPPAGPVFRSLTMKRYEDDKFHLPFTVTDVKGRNLERVNRSYNGQCVSVEQLTLDFEYLINEVIRNDASWATQFNFFRDYDVVILEVCPETNIVIINIGLLVSTSEEQHCRTNLYHTNLRVSWDLNTGACCTVGVGDLTEVKGQTIGRVWSSYRETCVNTVMKWLVPESGSRYINRMTNDALHKGSSLQVLADSDRCTWIVL